MRRLAILFALVGLSCAVQCWTICSAVVPAQDAIRYVLIAQAFNADGLLATLKEQVEQPLFPSLVWLTHAGLSWVSADGEFSWADSAQLAAAAMLVLTLVPLYFLLLRMSGKGPALVGAIFFCILPSVARLGADGLSDSTQLFFITTALWSLSRYWQTTPSVDRSAGSEEPRTAELQAPKPAWLIVFGLSTGLGLLARPEAFVLLLCLAVAGLWFQCHASWRQTSGRLALGAGCAMAGLAAVMGPYLLATGALSPMALAARVLGRDQPPVVTASVPEAAPLGSPKKTWRLSDGEAMAFGTKDRSVSIRFLGYRSAVAEYLRELPEVFHYWIGALALCGLWLARKDAARPMDRFAQLVFVAHSLAAVHMAAGLGYLSARHLLTLVVLGLAQAGRGALELGGRISTKYEGLSTKWKQSFRLSHFALRTSYCSRWLLAFVAAAACLPQTLAPLHVSRRSHRLAGEWLAAMADVPGSVLDTRGWTALYSRRPTYRYDAAKTAYRDRQLAYVVVVQRELELDSSRSRTLRHLLSGAAEQVALFAAPQESADTVLIYRWRQERFTKELRSGQSSVVSNP